MASNGLKEDDQPAKYKIIPYCVTRQVLQQNDIAKLSGYDRHKDTAIESVRETIKNLSFKSLLFDFLPILKWLPEYSVKKNFVGDLISGSTVAVMHIPQGLAYGLLAGVSPINGLYMAFFPVLVYAIFGTSRHVSIGTFAVVSIMTSKVVATYSTGNDRPLNSTTDGLEAISEGIEYTPIQVATATAMVAGIFQLIMCSLRMGALASLLSEPLVNGFTAAAAVHVMVNQLKDLLGITVPRHQGAFKILFTIKDAFYLLSTTNLTALYISIVCITFMFAMNEIVKPWALKKCLVPVPSELIAVLGGTILSHVFLFGPNYAVKLVGSIPVGLPAPELPPLSLLRLVALDSIGITIVSYTIVVSMGLIFAQKQQYEIRANQELLAMGLANITGSFFSCIPVACALSRSLIQFQTGGKTQLASVVSSSLILIVLLWIGRFFESLPRAVLAAIIIVALKGMFLQILDLKRFAKEGSLEAIVWISTFLSVIIIDIDIGLLVGVLVSILALYVKGFKSQYSLLGAVPDTKDIYVDLRTHKTAVPVPYVKIFRYCGSINFASRNGFKKNLFDNIGVNHQVLRRASMCENTNENRKLRDMRTLILDLSAVSHMDHAGCKTISEIKKELKVLDVQLLLCSPNDCVYDALLRSAVLGEATLQIFSTLHDSVLHSEVALDE